MSKSGPAEEAAIGGPTAAQGPATVLQGFDGVDQALQAGGFEELVGGDLQDHPAVEAVVVQELEEVPPGDNAINERLMIFAGVTS